MSPKHFASSKGVLLDDLNIPKYDKETTSEWKRFAEWRDSDQVGLSAGMRRELGKVAGAKAVTHGFMIACPYHADRTPSCTVTTEPGRRFFGRFRCYGCPAKGTWFELADRLNLDKLDANQQTEFVPKFIDTYYEEAFLGEQPTDREADPKQRVTRVGGDAGRRLGLYDFEPALLKRLGIDRYWREVPTPLLAAIGAQLEYWRSPKYPDMTPVWFVFLPVVVNGKRRGFSRAHLVKPPFKRPSYLNKGGPWASKYGLFPFDYSVNLMRERGLSTMVLVEGQRDALRMIRYGIPALAILGTQSWSEIKVRLLESADIERVVLMFDGDVAGKAATELIAPTLVTRFDVRVMRLWHTAARMNLKKLDPFEMPKAMVTKLKRIVYRTLDNL